MNEEDRIKNSSYMPVRIMTWIVLIAIIFCIFIGFGIKGIPRLSMEDCIKTDITALDGSVEHYDSNHFRLPKKGESLLFTLTIPEEASSIDSPVLCFFNYNSVITVKYNGEIIYKHGQEKNAKGYTTGHTMIRTALPNHPTGTVTITFLQQEDNTLADFTNVILMPAQYSWLYPVADFSSQISLLLFVVFAVVSFEIAIFNTVINTGKTSAIQGFFLSLFCVAMTIWAMGYTGTMFVLTNDDTLSPYIEYMATYLLPIWFNAYLLTGASSYGLRKKVGIVLEVYYVGLFSIATIVHFFAPHHDGYLVFLQMDYIVLMLGGLFFIFLVFHDRTSVGKVFRIGMIIMLLLAMLEVLVAMMGKIIPEAVSKTITTQAVTPALVLVFQAALLADYGSRAYRSFLEKEEVERLEMLAYTDILTGLRNRASFDDKEAALLSKSNNYAIAFIDADGLKATNDRFGHDAGDRLLKNVGSAIWKGCKDTHCKGYRYGGDEFLIVGVDEENISSAVQRMHDALAETNTSVSVGTACHDRASDETVSDVIHRADSAMYAEKQKHHKRREDTV